MKIKTCFSKDTVDKMKRKVTDLQNTYLIKDISGIYKVLSNPNNKKKKIPNKKWARDLNDD